MAISLQIVELWGVGGFRPPPGLTDFKTPGLNRVNEGISGKITCNSIKLAFSLEHSI